ASDHAGADDEDPQRRSELVFVGVADLLHEAGARRALQGPTARPSDQEGDDAAQQRRIMADGALDGWRGCQQRTKRHVLRDLRIRRLLTWMLATAAFTPIAIMAGRGRRIDAIGRLAPQRLWRYRHRLMLECQGGAGAADGRGGAQAQ